MARRLLIAGCGDLGQRLAARLEGWEAHGMRRRAKALSAPVIPHAADLSAPETLQPLAGQWDAVVYTATPGERNEAGYRTAYVDGLRNLLDAVQTDRLLFVSSTAVYGQDAGEWVDERSPTEPDAFNGRVLLEAEALARSVGGTAVRFSGIYGPGREWLLNRVRSGPVPCRRTPPVWTNRIHADDCAAVLDHLLHLDQIEPVYAASDECPAPRRDVLQWLADQLDAPGPVDDPDAGGGQGKRVSSARLLATGLVFQYPDYKHGYAAMLSDQ